MAEWITNGPCGACDSGDANASYSDGSTYCFSCGTYSNDGTLREIEVADDLLKVSYTDLSKRRLSEETCKLWGYGISTNYGETVQVAQYRSPSGKIVAQKLRRSDKSFQWVGHKDQGTPLFGQHLWAPHPRKKLVITEGELDALSVSQAQDNKWPVVSVPDGASSALKAILKALDYVSGFAEVILMFDQDSPGQEAALQVAMALPPGLVKIAVLPLKDASEMLQANRGAEIIKAIWEATPYRPDSILVGDELIDHLFKEMPTSADYFLDGLNKKLIGIRKREITMVCAGSGVGKTTFCQEQSHKLLEQGYKVGFVYLEQSVQITLLNILSIPLNTRLKLGGDIPRSEILKAFKGIQDRICVYNHFGSTDPDRLMQELRYMIQAEGCDYIVFDHISIVISGQKDQPNERQSIDYMMTSLRQLVEETGAGVLLVSHLKRPKGDTGFSEGKMPTMSDLRGSASLEQLSDVIIGLGRDVTEGINEVTVGVLKDRWQGNTGKATLAEFNRDTGRLEEQSEFSQEY